MMEFLAEVAAQVGWTIPVAIVLWFLARRLTTIVPSTEASAPAGEPTRPAGQRAFGLLGAAAALLAMTVALGWLVTRALPPVRDADAAVIDWLVAQRTDAATVVAHIFDTVGNTPGIIAAILIAATVAHAVTRRWAPALVLIAAAVGETSIFLAAQSTISRARPDVAQLAAEPATSSFPSGHVAASIVTYGCIALLVLVWTRGPLRVVVIVAAVSVPLAVAWARMYQGMHFPSDVLGSFVFAPLWLAACWWAFRPSLRGERVRWGSAGREGAERPAPALPLDRRGSARPRGR